MSSVFRIRKEVSLEQHTIRVPAGACRGARVYLPSTPGGQDFQDSFVIVPIDLPLPDVFTPVVLQAQAQGSETLWIMNRKPVGPHKVPVRAKDVAKLHQLEADYRIQNLTMDAMFTDYDFDVIARMSTIDHSGRYIYDIELISIIMNF